MAVKAYAGIGSRSTPREVLGEIRAIARWLAAHGWTLRTGGADGADEAFAWGSKGVGTWELFTPWHGFNGWTGGLLPTTRAYEIAATHHPAWARLSRAVQALHARNVHQVLGRDCESPSAFVLCWTRDGAEVETTGTTGGTGQAIRIAVASGVPVINMARPDWRERWAALVRRWA